MMEEMPPHPLLPHHHLLRPPATTTEEINDDDPVEMIPEQEAPLPHEVILADAEPKMPQPHLYHTLIMDELDDLDDDPNEGRSDMDEWFPKDGSNDRD
jgi:hypothetical protein